MGEHDHHEIKADASFGLWMNIFINISITLFEFLFGFFSGSYALLSDALHNLEDTGGIVLSLFAHKVSKKPMDKNKTYGYKRAGVIAAFVNSIVLLTIFGFLGYEAALRLIHPKIVNGEMIIWVALIALAGNALGTLLLYKNSKEDLNVKATFIHMMSDSLNSAAVVVVGILISVYHVYILDPLVTFAIIAYIVYEAMGVIKRSVDILMEGVPVKMNFNEIKRKIESINNVVSFHHLHVWTLDGKELLLEGHVRVKPMNMEKADSIRDRIVEMLGNDYGISHTTIQLEQEPCVCEELIFRSAPDVLCQRDR